MLRQRVPKPVQLSFCSCGRCGRVFAVVPISSAVTRADMMKAFTIEVDPLCDCWFWHGLSFAWVCGQWPKQVVR